MTLNEYYEQFIADRAQYVAPVTIKNYNLYFYRYISPVWGDREVSDLKRADVLVQVQKWLLVGAPVSEIVSRLTTLYVDLPHKPTCGVRVPRNEPQYRLLSHEDMQRAMRDGIGHKYYPVFMAMALTGMRPAELRGLQWRDVNFADNTISIQRIYNKRTIGPTKTPQSTRTIVMAQRLAECLLRYKQQSPGCKWVFVTQSGDPISAASTVRCWIGRFLEGIGIGYVIPYSFRHYFAASLIDAGIPVSTVQSFCGWSNERMALYYAARRGRLGMEQACALLDSDDF